VTAVTDRQSGDYYIFVILYSYKRKTEKRQRFVYEHKNLHFYVDSSFPVQLISPADGATGQPVALTLIWSRVSNATAYHVQVATNYSFTAIFAEDSTLTDTSKSIGGLSNSTIYFWRVRAKNAGGVSGWTSAWSFTTIVAAPQPPLLVSPSNAATNVPLNPTLKWNRVSGASSYQVQLADNSSFSVTILYVSGLVDSTHAASGLSASTLHYWRVKAVNAGGESGWSTDSFTTVPPNPGVPTLVSPSDNATDVSLNTALVWNTVGGALWYHVQLADNSSFSGPVINDSLLTPADTVKTASGLANGTTYYWRVRAKNAGGVSSWTSAWSFTSSAPAAPVLVSPADNATGIDLNPTLSWNASNGATSYRIQVSTSNIFLDDSSLTVVTPSIFFVIDNSGSMYGMGATNDPNALRFSVTRSFIDDTIYKKYPSAEVGLAVFGTHLMFDVNDSTAAANYPFIAKFPFKKPLQQYQHDTGNGGTVGAYVPLLKLDSVYANYGGLTGLQLLDTILVTATKTTPNNHTDLRYTPTSASLRTGTFYTTNITAGFDAAKSAMLSAKASRCSQYVIFLSDGEANSPTPNVMYYFRDSTMNVPTTFTVFFPGSATLANSVGLREIDTMTRNIRVNGYDTSTSGCTTMSNYWTSNAADLMSTLRSQILPQLWRVIALPQTICVDDSTTSLSEVISPLSANTTYYWRVNATNTIGTSAWSEVWSFLTIP
jgi:hypothetical protein